MFLCSVQICHLCYIIYYTKFVQFDVINLWNRITDAYRVFICWGHSINWLLNAALKLLLSFLMYLRWLFFFFVCLQMSLFFVLYFGIVIYECLQSIVYIQLIKSIVILLAHTVSRAWTVGEFVLLFTSKH